MSEYEQILNTFKANLSYSIRNRESIKIGGGVFSCDETKHLLTFLEELERYNKHGVTCQTYGDSVKVPCSECNIGYKNEQNRI